MTSVESRMASQGIVIPTPAAPVANYVGWVISGNLIFTAGQLAMVDGKVLNPGLAGGDVNLDAARAAARQCAINVIAQLKAACNGDLERIRRIVKLTGFVASVSGFTDQPKVINAASDLMVEAFGERGIHARSAVGVIALPLNASVEIEAVAEFH
jgi:enamine deaminase RidA (YjgF/YER057c/UK114 family)